MEFGYPAVKIAMLPCGRGHKYECEALWSNQRLVELFNAHASARSAKRLRGTVAQHFSLNVAAPIEQPVSCDKPADVRSLQQARAPRRPIQGTAGYAGYAARPRTEVATTSASNGFAKALLDFDAADSEEADDNLESSDGEEIASEVDTTLPVAPDEDGDPDKDIVDEKSASLHEDTDGMWRYETDLDVTDFSVEVDKDSLREAGIPEWAREAAHIFLKNGFVVLNNTITPSQAAHVLRDCMDAARRIVDEERPSGNRHGGARYSFGKSCGSTCSMLHLESFARHLLDNRAVLKLMRALASLSDQEAYNDHSTEPTRFKCISAGGDFVLAGERRFQAMHSDLNQVASVLNVKMPPPLVAVNYCVQAITPDNGPMRMLPGTQLKQGLWAKNPKEPAEWRRKRLFPLPEGAAIVRDVRTLHSGSPNFSPSCRFLPAVEFASTSFLATPRGRSYLCQKSLPRSIYETLRPCAHKVIPPEMISETDIVQEYVPEKRNNQSDRRRPRR